MNQENASIICECLSEVSHEYPHIRHDILLLCDRLESGSISNEEIRKMQQDELMGKVFNECYKRLGVIFVTPYLPKFEKEWLWT